jgi:RNase P subunit RPR2
MKRLPFYLIICLTILVVVMLNVEVPARAKFQNPKVKQVTTTLSGRVDLCLSCHKEKPDKAHGREVLGCAVCHKGNPLSGDKQRAHLGMVLNPGEFRFADKTCGQSGCHPNEFTWVKNSLMATNRGIISTLRFYWGESPDHNEDLSVKILKDTGMNSFALDYYRKLCGSCHLWVERRSLPSFLANKGGGCTACHFVKDEEKKPKDESHSRIIKVIPLENCVLCHNRSGRIGLSYQGQFESEGYGTPYEEGDFSSRELVDGRFYRIFKDDIHHEKGLTCIDCHTQKEIMGDGERHAHFEKQLEVTCRNCHWTSNHQVNKSLNSPGPPKLKILKKDSSFFLENKQNKKLHPLHAPNPVACLHPTHRRLSCQACHSTWVPQCYGCHVRMDRSKIQLDKVSIKETPGLWEEFRSFIRYECPPLGIFEHDKEGQETPSEKGWPQAEAGEVVVLVPG